MSTPLVVPRLQRAAGLSALRKTLIVALVARVVALMYVQNVVLHTLIPPFGLAALMVLWLVVAGVCATSWRWAALLQLSGQQCPISLASPPTPITSATPQSTAFSTKRSRESSCFRSS